MVEDPRLLVFDPDDLADERLDQNGRGIPPEGEVSLCEVHGLIESDWPRRQADTGDGIDIFSRPSRECLGIIDPHDGEAGGIVAADDDRLLARFVERQDSASSGRIL